MSPPVPSVQQRLAALEAAVELAQARRVALLLKLLLWLNDASDNAGYVALRAHIIERLAEEE